MSAYNVIIDLEGMQRWATKVDDADDIRQAVDRAWGLWSLDIPHASRVLNEHTGTLDIYATPVRESNRAE